MNSEYAHSELTHQIIGAAIQVQKSLGPGLLEKAYHTCLGIELQYRGIAFESEVPLPIVYRGVEVPFCYRIDIVVERLVLIEIKALDVLPPTAPAQVLTYLRLSHLHLGLLFNFNSVPLKRGIKRFVLSSAAPSAHSAVSAAE